MCKNVLNPPVALALPTQSTLMRGIVRIEGRQTHYLFEDAVDARTKLVTIRTHSVVDLPPPQQAGAAGR